MSFLHKGDLKVHGNLMSKNCVVNSRWTIKLQGFGLRCLIKSQNFDDSRQINYSSKQLNLVATLFIN